MILYIFYILTPSSLWVSWNQGLSSSPGHTPISHRHYCLSLSLISQDQGSTTTQIDRQKPRLWLSLTYSTTLPIPPSPNSWKATSLQCTYFITLSDPPRPRPRSDQVYILVNLVWYTEMGGAADLDYIPGWLSRERCQRLSYWAGVKAIRVTSTTHIPPKAWPDAKLTSFKSRLWLI